MMSYIPLSKTPTDQHPVIAKSYRYLLDELDSAMCGFRNLQYAGNTEVARIAGMIAEACCQIGEVWEAVQEIEAIERSRLAEERKRKPETSCYSDAGKVAAAAETAHC